MSARAKSPKSAFDPLDVVEKALAGTSTASKAWQKACRVLQDMADSAREAQATDVADGADLLRTLMELAECLPKDDSGGGRDALMQIGQSALEALKAAVQGGPDSAQQITQIGQAARERWGEYLELLSAQQQLDAEGDSRLWNETIDSSLPQSRGSENLDEEALASSRPSTGDPDTPSHSTSDLGSIVSNLLAQSSQEGAFGEQSKAAAAQITEPGGWFAESGRPKSPASADWPGTPPPPTAIEVDADLLSAFWDDATQCLTSMEQALLEYETNPTDPEPLRELCRGLHTLKGASASVGLGELAHYLHQVEDYVRSSSDDGPSIDVRPMLNSIDAVRAHIAALTGSGRSAAEEVGRVAERTTTAPLSALPRGTELVASSAGDSVRVPTARLDRLMDLLAELVVLRNRREARIAQLKDVYTELTRCVTRLRVFGDGLSVSHPFHRAVESEETALSGEEPSRRPRTSDNGTQEVSTLDEIASDISTLARHLRELYEPLAEDNLVVSRLAGRFRQELMELRRLPLLGLFRRLQRPARDAARAERKQVRVEFVGETAGLERSLQERLYEPLLHLVRNAVSHGVEPPDQRQARGKPPVGTVTLAARAETSSLVLEVRDDGRGLDYEKLERRGRELGLLPIGQHPDREQLLHLIFHPGFSTHGEVSEISGRGIGMDVVAAAVRRVRGQLELNSTPGVGTTVRLRIPLLSGIEHAMVVCTGGQLFALPIQYIYAANVGVELGATQAGSPASGAEGFHLPSDLPCVNLQQLLGLESGAPSGDPHVLIVGHVERSRSEEATGNGTEPVSFDPNRGVKKVALLVDAVLGPEEVVVRSLPPLLRQHQLFAGVTLSGEGEIVLLFDMPRLIERTLGHAGHVTSSDLLHALARSGAGMGKTLRSEAGERSTARKGGRILVVDDSLSTRRSLIQMLAKWGLEAVEASDAMEALDLLRHHQFLALLTDVEMPRLSGLELLAEVRQRQRVRAMPVIVVTNRHDEACRARAQELGANGYLVKPVTPTALAETLTECGLILSDQLSHAVVT